MFVYSLTYGINVFGGFVDKRSRQIITYFILICLTLISGTRYYMGGSDVYVYENVYKGAPSVGVVLKYLFTGVNNGVNENYETGYILICSIIKSAGFTYFGFTLVFAILFYMLLYHGLKYYIDDWSIFICVFMYKIFFYDTFISIRQGLTIAIFCYSIHFITQKKFIKYTISCLLAFLVHRGALILWPLYFMQYIPISKNIIRNAAIIFLPTRLISGVLDLGPLIENIIDIIGFAQKSAGWGEITEPISLIHTLECYIIFGVIIYFYDEIIDADEDAKVFLQLSLCLLPIFTIASQWIVLTRIKDYFVIFYGVILSFVVTGCESKPEKWGNTALAVRAATYLLCFIGMARYALVFDGGVLMQYTSFIFKGEHIFTWI